MLININMPRKSSSMGVLNNSINSSQNQIQIITNSFNNLVTDIQKYIDLNIKPQYIDFYFNEEYDSFDQYNTAYKNIILSKLNNFKNVANNTSDSTSKNLAIFAESVINLISKIRDETKESNELIEQLKEQLAIFAKQTAIVPPAPIRAIIDVNVSIDEKYLVYVQRYGVPHNGIFDQTILDDIEEELSQ